MKALSSPYQIMLLIAIVLAVYYPTLFAEICLIDDAQAITSLLNTEDFAFSDIFFPHTSSGGYYRPLIGLSYWIDKSFWFAETRLLHFEVLVAHVLNGVLVFFITRELCALMGLSKNGYLSLVAGLMFALHPVVTESVNWISGRTDVMMGNFVLFGFLLLLKYKSGGPRYLLIVSVIAAVVALLAKEAAFGYLIGLPLFIVYQVDTAPVDLDKKLLGYSFLFSYTIAVISAIYLNNFWLVLAVAFVFLLINLGKSITDYRALLKTKIYFGLVVAGIGVSVASFYLIRKIAYVSNVDKIGQTINLIFGDLNYAISLFLGAVGFYVKKFFMPLPLNFFIIEIDPLYDFAGIAVLLFVLYLLIIRSLPALLCLTGIFLVLPALPFAFGTIAWTAYAERYIYLSSAFWVMAVCLCLGKWIQNLSPIRMKYIALTTAGVIFLTASATYSRNLIWQKNVTLFENTVSQAPKIRKLRDIYVGALLDAGHIAEAKKQYAIASTLPVSIHNNRYDDRADLLMGGQLVREGDYKNALRIYEDAIIKTKYGSEELLAAAIQVIPAVLSTTADSQETMRLEALEISCSTHLKNITMNPSRLIGFGKIAYQRGSFVESVHLYDKALQNMAENDLKRTLVKRLRDEARSM